MARRLLEGTVVRPQDLEAKALPGTVYLVGAGPGGSWAPPPSRHAIYSPLATRFSSTSS